MLVEQVKPQEGGKFYRVFIIMSCDQPVCVCGGGVFCFSRPDLTNRNHGVEVLILILSTIFEHAVYSHAQLPGRTYSGNVGPKSFTFFTLIIKHVSTPLFLITHELTNQKVPSLQKVIVLSVQSVLCDTCSCLMGNNLQTIWLTQALSGSCSPPLLKIEAFYLF